MSPGPIYSHPEPGEYNAEETTGPFTTIYQWSVMDIEYPTEEERTIAISSQEFIPENNLPLGVEVYKDRMFISMPKWKPGIPITLAVLPTVPKEKSPKLVPYPSWNYHNSGKSPMLNNRRNCSLL